MISIFNIDNTYNGSFCLRRMVLNGQQLLNFEKVYRCSVYDDIIAVSRRYRNVGDSPLTFSRKDAIVEKFSASSLDAAVLEVMRKGAQAVAMDGTEFYVVKFIKESDVKILFDLGENYWEQRAWQGELNRVTYDGVKEMDDTIGPHMIHRTTRHGCGPKGMVF